MLLQSRGTLVVRNEPWVPSQLITLKHIHNHCRLTIKSLLNIASNNSFSFLCVECTKCGQLTSQIALTAQRDWVHGGVSTVNYSVWSRLQTSTSRSVVPSLLFILLIYLLNFENFLLSFIRVSERPKVLHALLPIGPQQTCFRFC